MGWTYLMVAVILEIAWALTLKSTVGFTRFWPAVANLCLVIANIWVLSQAFKTLPSSLAYSVWTGLGAAGVMIFSVIFQNEPMSLSKLLCIILIICVVM